MIARDRDHRGELPVVVVARLARQIEGRRVELLGAVEVHPREVDRRDLACYEPVRQLTDGEEVKGLLHGQPLRKMVSGCSSSSSSKLRSCSEI